MRRLLQVLRDVTASVAIWCLNPRCPWCDRRTSDLEKHMRDKHAGGRIEGWRR